MCGIATISVGRSSRNRIPYPRLRALVRELMVELEPRGKDASGIAIINENSDSVVYKKPLRPSRLVVRPVFNQSLEHIGPDTNFILLHARATTVGTNTNVFNNHPILIPDVIGIHNGTLINDMSLFKRYAEHFEQLGTVDSEVIFQLYKHHTRRGLESEAAMRTTAGELNGAFTGALVDLDHPNRMVMFKNERPLHIITVPHFDLVIAISEPKFFQDAAKRIKTEAKVQSCDYIHDGTGLIFDLNKPGKLIQNVHDFQLPIWKSKITTDKSKPWTAYSK